MTAVPAIGQDVVDVDVELLDPWELTAHPRNVRVDLGDLTGLTASIAAQGVLEPLIVVPLPDGGHLLIAGHRRAAAALAAELKRVPCIVRRDLAADVDDDRVQAEHVGAMLAENLHRQNLTAVEEARGVQTMLDLGFDVADVTARTGLDRSRVLKASGVARLAPAAAAAVADAGLTLDQAAVVVRYEDSPDVVDQLVTAAGEGPGRFAHAVTRAEQDRQLAEAVATKRAELEAAGRRVLQEEGPGQQQAERLFNLLQDGNTVDAEQHASCPGSAVAISGRHWGGEIEIREDEVCTDPAGNGHSQRWGRDPRGTPGSSMSDEELERQRAERREVIANNKAMAAANTTRRAWLREYFCRTKAPKEVLRFAVEAIAAHPDALYEWTSGMASQEAEHAWTELGLEKPRRYGPASTSPSLTNGEHVTDARLPLQLFAHVAAGIEGGMTKEAWRKGDHRRDRFVSWLSFLVDQGYELSDIEQQIVGRPKRKAR
ncbi:ParB/RepB/Spo0J family partition protein [Blastococcus sp. TF02A-26]|uniref:ParB/RepB/Spo0J family partition protein n=1 Tax=Blastococcus sp. TF02A-26 TaxID=2250577 RepID=UPI001314EBE7|nr:ParB/RepB/Spo0J family partition protein [Blastococcus sp. TF02A-26]